MFAQGVDEDVFSQSAAEVGCEIIEKLICRAAVRQGCSSVLICGRPSI